MGEYVSRAAAALEFGPALTFELGLEDLAQASRERELSTLGRSTSGSPLVGAGLYRWICSL
jgi:hypothetical protein